MSIGIRPIPTPDGRTAEHVVLLDGRGFPTGTTAKATAHSATTPFHLAFSCYLVRADGSVLLTRRAPTKTTWPGAWTNGCCGHPQMGETLREAVTRRVAEELGLQITHAVVAVPDFVYRAAMSDGTIEHELCPVVVAEVVGEPCPNAAEVDDLAWISWEELQARVASDPQSLSPWSVEQVRELSERARHPLELLTASGSPNGRGLMDARVLVDSGWGQASDRSSTGPTRGGALAAVQGPLRELLEQFLDRQASEMEAIDPRLGEVVAEVRALVDAGGKRLRPAFVWWGHRATGGPEDPAVVQPAAAVELLHTFALLHDDVMDRSATRRGRPSAYASFAAGHRQAARLGDPDWFGCSAAILAGDLTYVWADELFDGTAMAPAAVARARVVFTTLRSEVIAGQYLDLVLAADSQADEEGARRVALLKSARYTVTRPLLLGAALGTAVDAERVAPALTRYGDAVGMAFQMRDDILGLFGDASITGKSTLDDLREGKRTLLMLRALRMANPLERSYLLAHLGDPELTPNEADNVRSIVASTGALASVEILLRAEYGTAVEAVDDLPGPARAALIEMADLAIQRRT